MYFALVISDDRRTLIMIAYATGVGFALLSAAVIYHAIYNLLVQSRWSYVGILLPLCTYIPAVLLLRRSMKWAKQG